jgi:peptide chain release factor 2
MAATFEFKDAGNKLEQLEAALAAAAALFGLAAKKTALKDKEAVSVEAGFWDKAEKAQTHLKELNDLKKGVGLVNKLGRELEDCRAHLELARESGDPGELPLIMEELKVTEQKLSAFDFELKLSGPHDQADAIISIHSGAGGTEACDWAQMLLRMYTRWAQRKGFSFSITDILQGEEAGVKSVTAFINGK